MTRYTGAPRTIYRGVAIWRERSGRSEVQTFYAWATTDDKAKEDARRVFPRAQAIIIRKRGE